MAKNIEINYNNGTQYEVLYPKVLLNNVSDWNDSIYSKTEVDSAIQTGTEQENWTFFKTVTGSYSGQSATSYWSITQSFPLAQTADVLKRDWFILVKNFNITSIVWNSSATYDSFFVGVRDIPCIYVMKNTYNTTGGVMIKHFTYMTNFSGNYASYNAWGYIDFKQNSFSIGSEYNLTLKPILTYKDYEATSLAFTATVDLYYRNTIFRDTVL